MNKRLPTLLLWITSAAAIVFALHKMSLIHIPVGKTVSEAKQSNNTAAGKATGNSSQVPTGAGKETNTADSSTEREQELLQTLHQGVSVQANLNQQYLEGKSLFFQHKYSAAIKTENKVIQQSPLFYKAYNVKGIALCYAGKYQEGMSSIEKAISIAPNYDYARFNKGLALELYRHYDEALKVYHETIPIASHNWKMWSYYGIAAIYGRRGDVANTVKYLRKAIAMDPKHVRAVARTESDFNNVRNSPQFQQLVK